MRGLILTNQSVSECGQDDDETLSEANEEPEQEVRGRDGKAGGQI